MSNPPDNPAVPENLTDLVQPADAKVKALDQSRKRGPPVHRTPEPPRTDMSIIMSIISARTLGMAPRAPTLYFPISYEHLEPYFIQLREDLINLIFPTDEAPPRIIGQDAFVAVCKWLTCMRVQYVMMTNHGVRPRYNQVVYRPEFSIPTALARVLQGLGTAVKVNGMLTCSPSLNQAAPLEDHDRVVIVNTPDSAEANAIRDRILQDPNELIKQVEPNVLFQFRRFVALMHRRGASYVTTLGDDPNAQHPWYIHGLHDQLNRVANEAETTFVVTFDTQATPEEILIATVVQRRFNGLAAGGPGLLVEYQPNTDALGIRLRFNNAQ